VPQVLRLTYKLRRSEQVLRIFNLILPLSLKLIILMGLMIFSYTGIFI
jgi:hypothetical protein